MVTSTETSLEKTPRKDKYVIGSRVNDEGRQIVHTHRCGCECNSPYCETPRDIPCPEHDGPPIVIKGYEPWRGRS
jgi:hypothetical protein